VALITTLWFAVLLASLSTAFLFVVSADHRFHARQQNVTVAYFAARSGVELLSLRGLAGLEKSADGTRTWTLEAGARCIFSVDAASGAVTCTGVAKDAAGRTLATRDLVVPAADLEAFYEKRSAEGRP